MDMSLRFGFRFNPFESELISLYLKPKLLGEKFSCNVIEERELYGPNANPGQLFDPENHPWILSEVSSGKFEKITYAFVNLTKIAANSNSNKKSRVGRENYFKRAGCGTWDGQTKRTEIRDSEDNLIGERRMLVFEINEVYEDLSRVGGHWRMHEYHLCGVNKDVPNLCNTVLCKITLDQSKKPPIKLRPIKAPEKNETTKKKSTKKLDVVVVSSSLTNGAVVNTFEGISNTCGVSGPKGEEQQGCEINCDDDGMNDWIKSMLASKDEDWNLFIKLSEDFSSYPEPKHAQPLVDITNNMRKRKLQAESLCAMDSTKEVSKKLISSETERATTSEGNQSLTESDSGPAKHEAEHDSAATSPIDQVGEHAGKQVGKSQTITTTLASAGNILDGADAELVLNPLRLAFETKNIKVVELALDCLHKLIAYDHLECDPGLDGGKDAMMFTDILNMVCGCADNMSPYSTILQVLKVLLTAVSSTKFRAKIDKGVLTVERRHEQWLCTCDILQKTIN